MKLLQIHPSNMKTLRLIYINVALALFLVSCNNAPDKKEKKTNSVQSEIVENKPVNTNLYFQSALDGNITVIQEALDNGLEVNSINENKRTALIACNIGESILN